MFYIICSTQASSNHKSMMSLSINSRTALHNSSPFTYLQNQVGEGNILKQINHSKILEGSLLQLVDAIYFGLPSELSMPP